jgi:hypothetical protein
MPAIWAIRCNARFMRPEETVIQAPCTGFSTALVDYGLLAGRAEAPLFCRKPWVRRTAEDIRKRSGVDVGGFGAIRARWWSAVDRAGSRELLVDCYTGESE